MGFDSTTLERKKLRVTILIMMVAIFTFSNFSVAEAWWGKKDNDFPIVKAELIELSEEELEELGLMPSNFWDFSLYDEKEIKKVLEQEIDPNQFPGLTYKAYIANTLRQIKFVNSISSLEYREDFDAFFNSIIEQKTSFVSLAEKLGRSILIDATPFIFKDEIVKGASRVAGECVSLLLMAKDILVIEDVWEKVVLVKRYNGLYYYLQARKSKSSHEDALNSIARFEVKLSIREFLSGESPRKQQEKIVQEAGNWYKDTWEKWGEHIEDGGQISREKEATIKKTLRKTLLYKLEEVQRGTSEELQTKSIWQKIKNFFSRLNPFKQEAALVPPPTVEKKTKEQGEKDLQIQSPKEPSDKTTPKLPEVGDGEAKILENSLYFTKSTKGLTGPKRGLKGEIQNTGTKWLKDILITATFFDSRGYVLQEEKSQPAIEFLAPGQKSPFTVVYFPTDYRNYTLKVSWNIRSPEQIYEGLEVLDTKTAYRGVEGSIKYLDIEIHNKGNKTVDGRLLVTFYNDEGGVLSYNRGLGAFYGLFPNQVKTVSVFAPKEFSSYSLQKLCYE